MEIKGYDLIEFDGLWKQYAALSVDNELYDYITYVRSELEGQVMYTFPLKVDTESYRTPHFAVVALVAEAQEFEDKIVVTQYFLIREFNSDVFPNGDPIREIKMHSVPFDFEGRIWVSQVQSYIDALEIARREREIDELDD